MVNDKADKVIEELFKLLLNIYQIGSETSMTCRDFIFDCVYLLDCKYLKINFKRDGSYIDSLDWMKNKKATINPTNERDKCSQCTVRIPLNHEEIKKDMQRITKIKAFIDKYN